MSAPQNVIAVIFDFDDTLTDDSTTRLLEHHGIDPVDFWKVKAASLLKGGWDPTLAYLKLILDEVGPGKKLGNLTNQKLREFGSTLKIYSGVTTLFKDLKKIALEHPLSNPAVEFYVVSGGLEEIIRGSKIAKDLTGVWGNRFWEDPQRGCVSHLMNVLTFTEKTKHLFEINKGIVEKTRVEHYAVNQHVEQSARRVPFKNMIYVGDGLTDVPCFSLLQANQGNGFGVFDPKKEGSPKKAFETLVTTQRTKTVNSPHYGKNDDLGAFIRAAVHGICVRLDLALHQA
ncbi:MAG: hypothetical protein ACKVP0_00950 [Pirellulaceae bacterium]